MGNQFSKENVPIEKTIETVELKQFVRMTGKGSVTKLSASHFLLWLG